MFYQEIDTMISKYFPDKKSIEALKTQIEKLRKDGDGDQSGLNGHVFHPMEAFDRIIHSLERDGKQKEIS